jgi:hypothetical protein
MCRVRAAYKAVQRPRDLEKELPQCALGALLMQWLKQVRDAACTVVYSCQLRRTASRSCRFPAAARSGL